MIMKNDRSYSYSIIQTCFYSIYLVRKSFIWIFLDSPGGKGDELKEGSYHSIRRYIPDGHEHHFESSGVYRMKLLCVHII